VESLNIAGYAVVPRLEDEQKYGIIWYKAICQSPKHNLSAQGKYRQIKIPAASSGVLGANR
jgi:hypothetical protein